MTFSESVATVAFLVVGVVYLTRELANPAREVGLLLTCSALVGLALGVHVAKISYRFGARRTLVTALGVQVACFGMFLVVTWLPLFGLVVTVSVLAERTAYAARGAIMGQALAGSERVALRARLRAVGNVGAALGAVAGGAALQVGSGAAFLAAFGLCAVLLAVSCLLSRALPDVEPPPTGEGRHLVVWRDRPFLALALLNAVMCLHFGLFEVALPLWLVTETEAPHGLVGLLMLLNTGMVVVLQSWASRGTDDVPGASRALGLAGLLAVPACALFAAAGHHAGLAVVLLVLATVVYVWAEMLHVAAGWSFSYELAPETRHAEYQAAWGTSTNLGLALSAAFATAVVLAFGATGWIAAGVLFAVTAAASRPIARGAWRERRPAADLVGVG
jgi:hypothetical protein